MQLNGMSTSACTFLALYEIVKDCDSQPGGNRVMYGKPFGTFNILLFPIENSY